MSDQERFPDKARQLVAAVGADGARKLLALFAGRRVYIPRRAGESHPLTVAIGPELAAKLGEAFGGDEVYFPMIVGRKQRILDLAALGRAPNAIAAEAGVSIRHVHDVLSQARQGDQLTLF